MKNLGEYLSPEYSWWIADYGDTMTALNPEINPTSENIRIIFWCISCNECHVIKLSDVKLDDDGGYVFCCEHTRRGSFECYFSHCDVPEQLKQIFKEASASFEKNY